MNVLITAGPTREKIDPVRFISNRSSGRMGYAVAEAARDAGHKVTLISGPVSLPAPSGMDVIKIESAGEMADAVKKNFPNSDLIIMAAAVADYRPAHPLDGKMKKKSGPLFLELERTEDILATIGSMKKASQTLVGFAAETDDLEANAKGKLERKNLDWIAANYVADGFDTTENKIILFSARGDRIELHNAPKSVIAQRMIKIITAETE